MSEEKEMPLWPAFEHPLIETHMVREPITPLQQYNYSLLNLYLLWYFQQFGIGPFPALPLAHTNHPSPVLNGSTDTNTEDASEITNEAIIIETTEESGVSNASKGTDCCVPYIPSKKNDQKRRYRCAYPGCGRRYATTDGVRKHARKKHPKFAKEIKGQPNLLAFVDDTSDADTIEMVEEFVKYPPTPFDFSSVLSNP